MKNVVFMEFQVEFLIGNSESFFDGFLRQFKENLKEKYISKRKFYEK